MNESILRPELGQAKFPRHCLQEAKNILHLALMERRRWPEMLRPLFSLSTSIGLLGWRSQGLASFGQNVSLNQNSLSFVVSCSMMSISS